MKLIEQRKILVERIAAGDTQEAALIAAGFTPDTVAARMALDYLKTSDGTIALKRAMITNHLGIAEQAERTDADVLSDLRMVYGMSIDTGDLKTAVKCIELEGRTRGMFKEKVEVSGKVDIVNIIAAARKRVALGNKPSDVIDVDAKEKEEDDPIWM